MDWDSTYIRDFIGDLLEERAANHVTTLFPATLAVHARILAEHELVCAGLPLASRIFHAVDSSVQISIPAQDGLKMQRNDRVMQLQGSAAAILKAEQAVLSVLERLSSIATSTRRFVEKVSGTRARITRRSTPGMRELENYAVELGGGTASGLRSILLTTNHVRLAGGVKAVLDQTHSLLALQMRPRSMTAYEAVGEQSNMLQAGAPSVQIEVQDERELREAVDAGAEVVILRNARLGEARHFVQAAQSIRPNVIVELSGDITLANVRAYAETGADYLCCEQLTCPTPSTWFTLLVERREEK